MHLAASQTCCVDGLYHLPQLAYISSSLRTGEIKHWYPQRNVQFPFRLDISTHTYTYIYGAWGGIVATSRMVLGSIPGGVTGLFSDIFLPTLPWPWGRRSR